jgi:hypothetical protein
MPRAEVAPAVEELVRRHVRVIAVLLDARTFVPEAERAALPEVGAVVAQLAEAGAAPVLAVMGEDLRYPLTEVLRVFT